MAKRPRISEPRKVRQPFSIELLSMDVLESIKRLRNKHGLRWPEVELLSSLPYDKAWEAQIGKFGFVDWEAQSEKARARFPQRRIPRSNLYRGYTVLFRQANEELEERLKLTQEAAAIFVNGGLVGDDKAVLNAAGTLAFEMSQAPDDESRTEALRGLIDLSKAQQRARTNDIRERQVAVDEQGMQLKLEMVKKKAGALVRTLEGAEGEKPVQLTREQLLEQVKEIYGAV